MLADFTITIHPIPEYRFRPRKAMAVQVKVHDNVAALRSAATKYIKQNRPQETPDTSDTLGICHRMHMADDPVVAIVRLAPPNIGGGLVAHELCHAAVWMWEIHNEFKDDNPLTCENDEWFCWILGELVRHTTNKLYEHGVYKN